MKHLLFVAGALLFSGCTSAVDLEQYLSYQATVDGQHLVSKGFPAGSIQFDSTLAHVGSETFILYGIARCEIHLYAKANDAGEVGQLYWIQYEGYLPSLIPRSYDYSEEPYRTEIAGKTFFDSANYYNIDANMPDWSDDSDIKHVFNMLEQEGYQLNGDAMRIRMVLLDESQKNELMIMYMEPMESSGLSIQSLGPDGKTSQAWKDASQALRTRALSGMELTFN